jgi:SagB-type dehydrogenase family enzyme
MGVIPQKEDEVATKKDMDAFRYFLKDSVRQTIDFSLTDQVRGAAPPPIEKPCSEDALRMDLPQKDGWSRIKPPNLTAAIENRKSHRRFREEPLELDELAFLLWATQGIRKRVGESTAFRTVPSAGCRHALETYVFAFNVVGLDEALYRYLPLSHQLAEEAREEGLAERLVQAGFGQTFLGQAAATFVWTALPYRMEWRYDRAAHKVIALDAGHVCQNLYLASGAVGSGVCAVAAYHQEMMDDLLGVDGEEEFTIYLAALGKI